MSLPTFEAQAEARLQSAINRIPLGEWIEAATDLETAATIHRVAGRSAEEARCLGFAATLRRYAGDPEASDRLTNRALGAIPKDLPIAVALRAERAEAAFAEGRFADVVDLTTLVISGAWMADLGPDLPAAMLRRRAEAHIRLNDPGAANADYDAAAALLPADLVPFLRIEQAKAWLAVGNFDQIAAILPSIPTEDAHIAAEVGTLQARLLREEGRWAEAARTARNARSLALEAVAPVVYYTACVEHAEALRALGDRDRAYRTLVTAWVTLGDLLGRDVARSWVQPVLAAYQIAWGEEAFAAVKRAHDEARRREVTE